MLKLAERQHRRLASFCRVSGGTRCENYRLVELTARFLDGPPPGWRAKARRRRRGQVPVPKPVRGSWKIWYRVDQLQPDGSIRRVQRTKALRRKC
jgi:hypothetical protein